MSHPLFPDDSFPPGRNEPCFCGSGQRFKRCCGVRSSDRSPPFGVGIAEDFLTPEECRELLSLADGLPGRRFTRPAPEGGRTLDEQRITEWVDFRDGHQHLLDEVVARAFDERIIPVTAQSIDWYEEPQLLRYTAGGHYLHHSDAYLFVPERRAWRKALDRDISVLLYLNDEYAGGELEFKRLFYKLRPRAGMLVWFPSDVRYEHMARPVTSGRRSVVVSWAAAAGVERVQAQRANRAILWPSREKLTRRD
jgi:predicted 2-oxoglutarate/Fe(II)-dependent dioxygenase YbiX